MEQEKGINAWVYARDDGVPQSVLIAQMAQLLDEAARRGIRTVGTSQDMCRGDMPDCAGMRAAMSAINTGIANAVLVRDVERLSENWHTLLHIMEILQNHGAVPICTAEDAYAGLRIKNVSQTLCQRAACFGLGVPWIQQGVIIR